MSIFYCGLGLGQIQFCNQDEKCYLPLSLLKLGVRLAVSQGHKETHTIQHTYSCFKNRQERLFSLSQHSEESQSANHKNSYCVEPKHQVDCFSLSIHTKCNQNTLHLKKHLICGILFFK